MFSEYNGESSVNTNTRAIRKQIVDLRNEGSAYRQIAECVKVPYSTVGAIVWKHRQTGAVSNLSRVGAARKILGCSRCYMLHRWRMNPWQHVHTYRKNWSYKEFTRRKKVSGELHRSGVRSFTSRRTLLTAKHVKNRLTSAKDHLYKGIEFWERVGWSNESQIKLFGRNEASHVWRKPETAFDPKNTIPTIKHEEGQHHGVDLFYCRW